MLESLLFFPAMTTGLIKGLIFPHKPSLSFPTLAHGAVLGEWGSQDPAPLIPASQWSQDSSVIPVVFLGSLRIIEHPKTIQHQFLSHHVHLLKPVSPVMCVRYHFQNASATQHTLRYSTEKHVCPVGMCLYVFLYRCSAV